MTNQPTVNLLFAMQGDEIKSVRDFQDLRGAKARPTDLTCPECGHSVTVKLSPEHKIADHFAHLPDATCRLQHGGESAQHLNAKAGLAMWMGRYHKMALSHKCLACQNWETYLKFDEYDQVVPELRFGKRKPDISMLNGGETVGAAEVRHTHSVSAEKAQDFAEMKLKWFEIPSAGAHKKFYNVHAFEQGWFTIDARAAGVLFPAAPNYCEVCAHFKRKEIEARNREQAFQRDFFRVQQIIPLSERVAWNREQQEAAVEALREREERTKSERDKWEQKDGAARLTENGELIIPRFSQHGYRYWSGGQTIWQTLAELKASASTVRGYAMRVDRLHSGMAVTDCKGEIAEVDGLRYCMECGHYEEMINA